MCKCNIYCFRDLKLQHGLSLFILLERTKVIIVNLNCKIILMS